MQIKNNCPYVHLLLVNESNEKVELIYNSDPNPVIMPKIGKRPPYYVNPRCELYYPTV